MRFLIASPEQSSLTGQPMYVKNLAKGLREKGHCVDCIENGKYGRGEYDLVIINDYAPVFLKKIHAKRIVNVLHSMNKCDRPIKDLEYIAPRQEILDAHKVEGIIIPIPIDIKKFQVPLIEHLFANLV